jgi:hypothetical protein
MPLCGVFFTFLMYVLSLSSHLVDDVLAVWRMVTCNIRVRTLSVMSLDISLPMVSFRT